MPIFSQQAEFVELSLTIAYSCASMAMSSVWAAASMALVVPLAMASTARVEVVPPPPQVVPEAESPGAPYAAYRSNGGHASTLVRMGPMPG